MNTSAHYPPSILFAQPDTTSCTSASVLQTDAVLPPLPSDLGDVYASNPTSQWTNMRLLEDVAPYVDAQHLGVPSPLRGDRDPFMGSVGLDVATDFPLSATQNLGDELWSMSGSIFGAPDSDAPDFGTPGSASYAPHLSYPVQPSYDASMTPNPLQSTMAPNAPMLGPCTLPADAAEFAGVDVKPTAQFGSQWELVVPSLKDAHNAYLTPPPSPLPQAVILAQRTAALAHWAAAHGLHMSGMGPGLPSPPQSLQSPAPLMSEAPLDSDAWVTDAEPAPPSPPPKKTKRTSGKRKASSTSRSAVERALGKASTKARAPVNSKAGNPSPSSLPSPSSRYTGRFEHLEITRYTSRTGAAQGDTIPAAVRAGDGYACPLPECEKQFMRLGDVKRHIKQHFEDLRDGPVCMGVRIAADDPRAGQWPQRCREDDAGQVWFGGCWKEFSRPETLKRHAISGPKCRQGLPPV